MHHPIWDLADAAASRYLQVGVDPGPAASLWPAAAIERRLCHLVCSSPSKVPGTRRLRAGRRCLTLSWRARVCAWVSQDSGFRAPRGRRRYDNRSAQWQVAANRSTPRAHRLLFGSGRDTPRSLALRTSLRGTIATAPSSYRLSPVDPEMNSIWFWQNEIRISRKSNALGKWPA